MNIIYNKGLKKELLNAIKSRQYTREQLISMYQELNKRQSNKNSGMRNAMLAFAVCAVFVLGASVMNSPDMMMIIFPLLACIVVFIVAFSYLKINFVNKAKRQFMDALEIGYPELVEEFKYFQ